MSIEMLDKEITTMPFRKATWVAVADRVVEFLFKSDIEYSEFQSCTMAILWGFWLIFTPVNYGIYTDQYGVESIPQTLAIMKSLFPSWVWSLWFLILGVGHLMALAKKLWTARRFFSFVATCTWLYVAIFLGLTNFRMIAVPTAMFFSMGAAWGFWRLRSTHFNTRTSQDG